MEMAFFEQLPNHKQLKLCALRLWFKDPGGTTKKNANDLQNKLLAFFLFAFSLDFDYNLTTF